MSGNVALVIASGKIQTAQIDELTDRLIAELWRKRDDLRLTISQRRILKDELVCRLEAASLALDQVARFCRIRGEEISIGHDSWQPIEQVPEFAEQVRRRSR